MEGSVKIMEQLYVVTKEKTAKAMGSGELEVLATPALVAMFENAAMLALTADTKAGETSVGAFINVDHLKASKVGVEIRITGQMVLSGHKANFELEAYEGDQLIGKATHLRVIVQKDKFMQRLG
jgi:predicted thioesterase